MERTKGYANRTRHWLGGALTGVGTLGIVAIMMLAPAASAAPATFRGTTAYVDVTTGHEGCASAKNPHPGISAATGVGRLDMSGAAKTCGASKGGVSTISEALDDDDVGLLYTTTLGAPATYVNSTWNISAAVSSSAAGTLVRSSCPWYNFSGASATFFGNGTVATGFIYYSSQTCEVITYWEMFIEPYVYDATTGATTYSPTYYLAYNQTGSEYYYYNETLVITSPWNATYYYTGNGTYSYGTTSSQTINTGPSFNISGSWAKGDHIELLDTAFVYAYSEVYYAKAAKAKFSIDASGGTHHIDIKSITVG